MIDSFSMSMTEQTGYVPSAATVELRKLCINLTEEQYSKNVKTVHTMVSTSTKLVLF